MKTKHCSKCSRSKPESEFGRRTRDKKARLAAYCRECMNAYHVERRKRSPEARAAHTAVIRRRKQELLEEVRAYKARHPCSDCGQRWHPWQLQFDHPEGVQKEENVASMINTCGSPAKIWKEIEKCEIVCANCHADRTYRRNN